ncbi:heme A synthase [Halomonas elongata]|uniref:Heme A synthase n=1 Tax=Halomonas elongata TaxID=2746 RepID=A0A1B8P2J2_HALEL|nr:heme A synthase [Halomonas elongata]
MVAEHGLGEGFHLTQTVGPNYLHGQLHGEARSAIQMGHRLGGVALFLCLLGLGLRHRRDRGVSPWLGAMGGACLLQAALGIANVLFWLPLWLALLHTAGAAVLVTATLLAVWHWRWGDTVARSSPSVAARELMHA